MDLRMQAADNEGGTMPMAGDAGPGAQLRAAREAAGLSIDQVAQQLKLAARQVKALEDEDFGVLPGRTFTRGFLRNYARLLGLDADLLVAHLPDATRSPALDSPPLHSTGTTMAELPVSAAPAPSFGRWLIPLLLVACIVGAAGYEWYRGRPANPLGAALPNAPAQAAPAVSTRALANPLVPDAAPAAGATPTPPAATSPEPLSTPAPATSGALSPAPSTATVAAAAPADANPDAAIVIRYAGPSWTEIRDQRGQTLISRLVPAASVAPFDGTPPFSVVIGNARVVTLVYRGETVDLAPYTRQNVARLVLR
ncbi:MAG TPA: RodZ domain-containing protein [Casimicrobiaceae bacterium]|nr:RodZ domain-containing protein [Casimicrobiaceae bacterium]